MWRWQIFSGVAVGVLLGFVVLALADKSASPKRQTDVILPECRGRMSQVVIQYEPGSRAIVGPVYHSFLGALDSDVIVHAVCPDEAAFADLRSVVGKTRCRILPVYTRHPITAWSRDRWVTLVPKSASAPATLLAPKGENGDNIWPARAGDEQVAADLAAALPDSFKFIRSQFYFDGGDLLADEDNVFVVPRLLPRNIQHTVSGRVEFVTELTAQLGRHVILLDQAPDHHAGMFMASIGNKTVIVGDPGWGEKLLPPGFDLPQGPDFSAATQHLFDAVADQCVEAGYCVCRIPVVPARDQKTYLTYLNVLLDRVGSRAIVYMPIYRGVQPLNNAARAVWERLGFEVRPIDCTSTFRSYGCLHCLVNVVKRS